MNDWSSKRMYLRAEPRGHERALSPETLTWRRALRARGEVIVVRHPARLCGHALPSLAPRPACGRLVFARRGRGSDFRLRTGRAEADPQGAAPCRRRGALEAAHPARRHRHRRDRRAALRPRRRGGRGQPHHEHPERRLSRGRPSRPTSGRRPSRGTRRSTSPATTCFRASSTCTATWAASSRGRPRNTSSSSGWATASPRCATPGSGNGLDWMVEAKGEERAQRDHRPAARGLRPSSASAARRPSATAEAARAWVAEQKRGGADGLKLMGLRPDLLAATLDEAKKQGLRTACHHAQLNVAWNNVLDSARLGLTTMEHWYGLPEALFDDRTVQDYPLDYNYRDEQHRFGQRGAPLEAGRASRAARSGTRSWTSCSSSTSPSCRPSPSTRPAATSCARAAPSGTTSTRCRRSGRSTAQPQGARLVLVRLDHGRRGGLEGELPSLDALPERIQEPRRPSRHRLRLGLHLQALRLRLHPRARAAARSGLPPPRGDPRRDAEGRRGPGPAEGHRNGRDRASSPTSWWWRRTRSRTSRRSTAPAPSAERPERGRRGWAA